MDFNQIIAFRKHLHKNPELSGFEESTSNYISQVIGENCGDATIFKLSNYGLLIRFKGSLPGKKILLRCELDALPINEINTSTYKSIYENVSHCCGHDGHMAILIGVAFGIQRMDLLKGEVFLLFQPAEEEGWGAKAVLEDELFNQECCPDLVYALHNVPGFELGTVVLKDNVFNPSVVSARINLNGKTSHAAEPEFGLNPAKTISQIIEKISLLERDESHGKDEVVITPIFIKMGAEAYGTSPGFGSMGFTLRTYQENGIDLLKDQFSKIINELIKKNQLVGEIEWLQEFRSVRNSNDCINTIERASKINGLNVLIKNRPFRWGEDFGLFTEKYKGAMFGLGAGVNSPFLHNPDYDFPDELIEIGSNLFLRIIELSQE